MRLRVIGRLDVIQSARYWHLPLLLLLLCLNCSFPCVANFRFNFLTRLHYCAADVVTWGPQSPWGEHEIDYILFIRPTMIGKQEGGQAASSPPSPPSPPSLSISPNPEEVGEYRWVNQKQLKAMLANQDLLWSPWFRIIEREFLHTW